MKRFNTNVTNTLYLNNFRLFNKSKIKCQFDKMIKRPLTVYRGLKIKLIIKRIRLTRCVSRVGSLLIMVSKR